MIRFEWLKDTIVVHADSLEELKSVDKFVEFKNRWPNMKLKLISEGEIVGGEFAAAYLTSN